MQDPIEKLKEDLKEIARLISEEDRLSAALHFTCSYKTIMRYLSGHVKKIAFGKKLLEYLQERAIVKI